MTAQKAIEKAYNAKAAISARYGVPLSAIVWQDENRFIIVSNCQGFDRVEPMTT